MVLRLAGKAHVVGGRDEGGAVVDPHDQGGEHGVEGAPHHRLWIGVVDVVAGVHQRRGDKVAEFAAVVRAAAPDLGVGGGDEHDRAQECGVAEEDGRYLAHDLVRQLGPRPGRPGRPGSARAAWSARTRATPCS